jgi:glycine dehydrogenase subunit 1
MKKHSKRAYPYIPNSTPEIKEQMLKEIGVDKIEDLYADIPENLRYKNKLNLPPPLTSENALKRHMGEIFA